MGYNSNKTGAQIEEILNRALLKGNTEEFTPVGDYDPATKKFVEESINEVTGDLGDVENLNTESKTVVESINEVLATVEDNVEATAVTIETKGPLGDYAQVYKIKQGETVIGEINIPKELFVQSGEVVENPEGHEEGTYIKLVLQNVTNPLFVNVAKLVDVYTVEKDAAQVQLAINSLNEISATIVAGSIGATELADNSITKSKLDSSVQSSLDKADAAWTEVKSSSPFVNQEYADIVVNAITNGAISSDDYNKLSAWAVPIIGEIYPYAETLYQGAVGRMTIANKGEGVYVYLHITHTSTNIPLESMFNLVEIKADLTIAVKELKLLRIDVSGDGTKFLADDGNYKEIKPGISDAPKDGKPYGRILGNWGVIKQDTLDSYDVSSDGQVFNFTKNLEKGIVQYAEIYNPLGTEVTVYIKRDTDTRQVEVKIAPGATVLFRIISGIKGFYLEKVYYSSL